MPEWPWSQLGEFAEVRSGYAFKSKDWSQVGLPVVKIANVKDGRLEMDGCSLIPIEIAEKVPEYRLSKGDIVIAMTGYIGDVARVDSGGPYMLNQRVGRFAVFDDQALNTDYLFYVLRWPVIKREIESRGYGSAQPNISPDLIHSVEIPVPPLSEQERIAHILGTLDDKIELNRRMNRTLEAVARAIFKSWFIDFDPVHAKAEGHDPLGMDPETAALFPDSFQPACRDARGAGRHSPLGKIPKGWEVKPFSEIVDINPPRTLKKGRNAPYVDMASLPTSGSQLGGLPNTRKYNGCSPELEYGYTAGTPHGLPLLATRGQLLSSGHSDSSAGEHLRQGDLRSFE